jgi:hypothetical protein
VSPLQLSSAVTFGHPSSVTVNLTHNSSSGGTFSHVSNAISAQNSYFAKFVFHSHMSDHLGYFPLVEHWPSARTTPSSHCSIRIDLRSDLTWVLFGFSAELFSTPLVIDPLCLVVRSESQHTKTNNQAVPKTALFAMTQADLLNKRSKS